MLDLILLPLSVITASDNIQDSIPITPCSITEMQKIPVASRVLLKNCHICGCKVRLTDRKCKMCGANLGYNTSVRQNPQRPTGNVYGPPRAPVSIKPPVKNKTSRDAKVKEGQQQVKNNQERPEFMMGRIYGSPAMLRERNGLKQEQVRKNKSDTTIDSTKESVSEKGNKDSEGRKNEASDAKK